MTEKTIAEALREDGFYVSTTSGSSMRPMLRDRRDRVVLRAVKEGEILKKWDLPLYLTPDGRYILHRIIAVRRGGYITRGDNTYQKERVPQEWVLGYVTEFYRKNRHVCTDSRRYRFYAAFWNLIYPVRFLVWKVRCFAIAVGRRLFRR